MYNLIYTREEKFGESREHPDFIYIMPVLSFFTEVTGLITKALYAFFKENRDHLDGIDWDDHFSLFRFSLPASIVSGTIKSFLIEMEEKYKSQAGDHTVNDKDLDSLESDIGHIADEFQALADSESKASAAYGLMKASQISHLAKSEAYDICAAKVRALLEKTKGSHG